MDYRSVTCAVRDEDAENLGDALLEAGALSVDIADADAGTTHEQPIFGEPGATPLMWNSVRLTALIPSGTDAHALFATACAAAGIALPALSVTTVEDVDWVLRNRDQFQPICITDRLWIVPTWHDAPVRDAVNLRLDPGTAFGTGSHPTTRMCLQWLSENLGRFPAATVLDYGCGSGILAIAAMKLGAAAAIGIDIDEAAVAAARRNASQNDVELMVSSAEKAFPVSADVTLANILANPLKALAPLLAAKTRTGGALILAGLLDSQAAELIGIYAPWFALERYRSEEGWTCLAGRRC